MHSKPVFMTILLSYAAKSLDSLGNSAWGAWGARAQEAKVSKAWNLPLTFKKAIDKVSGRSLAQHQADLISPT